MPWSTIHNIIAAAECNVLIILSCCYAGAAEIAPKTQHAKELVTISSWNEMSYGSSTGPAIQKAVERWYKGTEPSDWTGFKFYSTLSNVIRETRASKIQEHLTALQGYEKKFNDAKDELAKLGSPEDPKESEKKSQMELVANCAVWEMFVQREKDMLNKTKQCYTQPHFLGGQEGREGIAKDGKDGSIAGERNTWRLWNPPRKEKK